MEIDRYEFYISYYIKWGKMHASFNSGCIVVLFPGAILHFISISRSDQYPIWPIRPISNFNFYHSSNTTILTFSPIICKTKAHVEASRSLSLKNLKMFFVIPFDVTQNLFISFLSIPIQTLINQFSIYWHSFYVKIKIMNQGSEDSVSVCLCLFCATGTSNNQTI